MTTMTNLSFLGLSKHLGQVRLHTISKVTLELESLQAFHPAPSIVFST